MRSASKMSAVSLLVSLAACAPAVTGYDVTGDQDGCTIELSCGEGGCAGVRYTIDCAYNATNDIYDCTCKTDGVEGESFSEAELCESSNGVFTHIDLADASEHGVSDCNFPVTKSP